MMDMSRETVALGDVDRKGLYTRISRRKGLSYLASDVDRNRLYFRIRIRISRGECVLYLASARLVRRTEVNT